MYNFGGKKANKRDFIDLVKPGPLGTGNICILAGPLHAGAL